MRRILALVMTLVIGFSLGDCVSYAAESQADNAPTVFFEKPYDNNPVTPERIVHSYYVSVKVPYSSAFNINPIRECQNHHKQTHQNFFST